MSALLSKFIAYQRSIESFALTARASRRWRGFRSLVDQVRRAAGSVAHNLAEGNAHPPKSSERLRYQRMAFGSALEVESALDAATAAALGDATELAEARRAASEVARILASLVRNSD